MKISNKIISLFALALFLILAQSAYAVAIPSTAQILGPTIPDDQSTIIFTHLLGNFFTSPLSSVTGSTSLIGSMFLIFNAAVFVIGMLWAGYGIIGGIAETAQTGEILGKRLSAVWLPIRMVTGIAGIVPVFAGYSLSQVFIVTMTAAGIGIANSMWVGAIGSINSFQGLSQMGVKVIGKPNLDAERIANDLFILHTCYFATQYNNANDAISGVDKITYTAPTLINGLFSLNISVSSDKDKDVCGKISLKHNKILDSGRWKTSLVGFRNNMVNYDQYASSISTAYISNFAAFDAAVTAISQNWYTARKTALNSPNSAVVEYPEDLLNAAAKDYLSNVSTALTATATKASSDLGGSGTGGLSTQAAANMKENGWMSAGAWFSTFAEANAALSDAFNSMSYSFDPPKLKGDKLSNGTLEDIIGATKSKKSTQDNVSNIGGTNNDFNEFTKYIIKKMNLFPYTGASQNDSLGQFMVKQAIDLATWGSGGAGSNALINPITMFKNLGDYMMIFAETIWTLNAVANAVPDIIKDVADWTATIVGVVGTLFGQPELALPAVLIKVVKTIGPFLVVAAPYIMIIGMIASIYIPMIPFITWMGGLVQYVVVVCQGLVGAPIAALSHLEAEGEGMGRRTEAGYMFILNVTFRPALMLFGFFLASALLIVVGTFQINLFMLAMNSAQGNSVTGLASFAGFITLFIIMNITLIQGLFNMIFLLPDQVLSLVGSHGGNADGIGKNTEDKMHAVFTRFGTTAQGGMGKGREISAGIKSAKSEGGETATEGPSGSGTRTARKSRK